MSIEIVKTATVPVGREWYVEWDEEANLFALRVVSVAMSTDGVKTAESATTTSDGTNFDTITSAQLYAHQTALQDAGYTIIGTTVS